MGAAAPGRARFERPLAAAESGTGAGAGGSSAGSSAGSEGSATSSGEARFFCEARGLVGGMTWAPGDVGSTGRATCERA